MEAWASKARTKLEQLRAERAEAFTGVHYETEDGTVAVDVGPDLELRSCRIQPLESNFRDVLERAVVQAYNTAMAEAVTERAEAYRNLAEARRNGS
jgi:DNA-binding protein YbaB